MHITCQSGADGIPKSVGDRHTHAYGMPMIYSCTEMRYVSSTPPNCIYICQFWCLMSEKENADFGPFVQKRERRFWLYLHHIIPRLGANHMEIRCQSRAGGMPKSTYDIQYIYGSTTVSDTFGDGITEKVAMIDEYYFSKCSILNRIN